MNQRMFYEFENVFFLINFEKKLFFFYEFENCSFY